MNAQLKATPQERKKTPKRDKWPKQIRDEDCRFPVTVYRRLRASGKTGFMVANYANGTRVLESFEEEEDAIDRAKDLSRLLSNRQSLAGQLSNEDAVSFNAAREILEPAGLALLPTIQTAIAAVRLTGSLPAVLKACETYATRLGRNIKPKLVAEAVLEFIAEREANGCGKRYAGDLTSRLGRFADDFNCNLSSVTGDAIQTWIDGLKVGPQTRINFRRVFSTFFSFCVRRGYLPRDWDEIQRLAPVKRRRGGAVAIYTPNELRLLLNHAPADFAPSLVIQAFCGLRSAEVERLRWEDVNLAQGHLTVGAHASKTASRRIVPLCDAARDWLAPHANSKGAVWKGEHAAFYDAQRDTAEAAGMKWKHNALRHSFCSYRLAQTGDAARTAFEAGNSAAMVHRHYKELVTSKDAAEWFAIAPPKTSGNIVPLAAQIA